MAKRPRKKMTLPAVRSERTICGQSMEAVYHVPALQPALRGPWSSEADKLAWTDPATGLCCIIRRAPGGFLRGYVAVGLGHPLFGFRADAVPTAISAVHGGLTYAAPCDEQAPEETSICHVAERQLTHADQWWFGFSCNQITDLIPEDAAHAAKAQHLGLDQEYRHERYLVGACTQLARQLTSAADPKMNPSLGRDSKEEKGI